MEQIEHLGNDSRDPGVMIGVVGRDWFWNLVGAGSGGFGDRA